MVESCVGYMIDLIVLFSISVLLIIVLYCFFFQAEDGIRYLVRSRGLGDVYKRQVYGIILRQRPSPLIHYSAKMDDLCLLKKTITTIPVSYTHLTLPTSDLV